MANYVARYRNYPVPIGQPGFDTNLTNWDLCTDRWSPPGSTLGLPGSMTELYLFGHGAWYVGVMTGRPEWYKHKEFMCTTNTQDWVECYQARAAGYWNYTSVGILCSNVGGTITFNPNSTEAVKSAWYCYFHPFVNDGYVGPDWWDVQMAGNDINKLLFVGPENLDIKSDPLITSLGGASHTNDGFSSAVRRCPPSRRRFLSARFSSHMVPTSGQVPRTVAGLAIGKIRTTFTQTARLSRLCVEVIRRQNYFAVRHHSSSISSAYSRCE